jgi:crotonobetainyl-CoA:carnitine CoA-transferase CaiB-like acyl-CoA transferase
MPELVVGQRGEEQAVAREPGQLDGCHGAAAPWFRPGVEGVDDLTGGRHALDSGELDPLDMPDDCDPCWHRLTLTAVDGPARCGRLRFSCRAYRVAVGDEGLLAGVRVLDLSIWRPGPYATQLLVELGADVVKVEPPGGDPMRVFPTLFAVLNAGKRSAAVDLKDDAGRHAVLARAKDADVVVEGFRPGVVRTLGVDDESIRRVCPSIVYCSISGYGQTGPLAEVPGHDVNYQAWAAVLEPRAGEGPVVARPPIADLAGGVYAAMAVCAALVRRSRTGEGESIDVSMTDILASWVGAVPPLTLSDGQAMGGQVPGYGTFETADGGWIALGVISEDHFWSALMVTLGLDDAGSLSFGERLALGKALAARIEASIATRDRDDLVNELAAAGVPVSPVLSQGEMLAAQPLRERGTVTSGPDGGPVMQHPLQYRNHPGRVPPDVPPLVEGPDQLPEWRSE